MPRGESVRERSHLVRRVQASAHPALRHSSIHLISEVKTALAGTSVKVGAQNMHWADEGAWTGEISPVMLGDCGLDIVELGHSERREHFGETDVTVGLKVEAAVRHGLIPLICIGETLPEREPDARARSSSARSAARWETYPPSRRTNPFYSPTSPFGPSASTASPRRRTMPTRARPKSSRSPEMFWATAFLASMVVRSIQTTAKS